MEDIEMPVEQKPNGKGIVEYQATPASAMVAVIERVAMDNSVDVEKLEKMLDMQERIMAKNAEMAFNQAMSRLDFPAIKRTAKAHNSSYARYEDMDRIIRPVYQAEGFSLSFNSRRNEDGTITYTGKLSHKDGHSQTAEIVLPADTSGSKAAIQAMGSSTSYARRYLAQMLLNIVTEGEDDDGNAAALKPIDNSFAVEIDQRLNALPDTKEAKPKFLAYMKVKNVTDIPTRDLQKALVALRQKEAAVKK